MNQYFRGQNIGQFVLAGTPRVKNWRIFAGAELYCPIALAQGSWCIQIREKMLDFTGVTYVVFLLCVH